ncbi:hypothetical protein QJS10_CPB22g01523 [Acorus calamus]|uniref:Uncharacterized protein n=1 Tax=Acorus calamus TaxID=4465 RepID=A0AAV9BZL8_ACOCL|nr:hypothetical protein QJS10_CPB22g01523 [Acorus calamus]
MDRDENDQLSSMPILPRLDRLDRLVCHLEEKSSSSESYFSGPIPTSQDDNEKQCKPLPAALEEVHSKGTLMERVAVLENRVLQMSLELEKRSMSGSSMNCSGKKSPARTISEVFDVTEDINEQEIQVS